MDKVIKEYRTKDIPWTDSKGNPRSIELWYTRFESGFFRIGITDESCVDHWYKEGQDNPDEALFTMALQKAVNLLEQYKV